MQKPLLAALSVAVVFGATIVASRAPAMPLAAPPALSVANARGAAVRLAAMVCGNTGCAPVLVKRLQKPPQKFATTATPLAIPGSRSAPVIPAAHAPLVTPAALSSLRLPAAPSLPRLPPLPWPLSLLSRN